LHYKNDSLILSIGPSSAGTSQQNLQEISALATVQSKGKEKEPDIQVFEKFTMTEQPETSKEQVQVQIPPIQINEPEISILQTPINIEKGKKRDVEVATPVGGSSEQPHAKRQKLNPLPEVDFVQEIPDSQREDLDSQQTGTVSGASTTLQRKELQKQQSVEISSFKTPVKDAGDTKKNFINIKQE